MKILVAEDDSVTSLLLQRTLQRFGYEVVLAEDGRAASEILSREDAPRLAILDWMMPRLDGPGLCRELRARRSDKGYVYILLLTAKQNSVDVVAGLEAGADDYITKPCDPSELRARLHTGRRILSLENELVQAREEMRYKATHDSLTSLWNRASILSLVNSELQRSLREHKPVSVLLCDVDHFKHINDTHGHLAGDLVLQEVSERLVSAIRPYDAIGRYGGEEFLVLLSSCDRNGVKSRSEEIRKAINVRPFEVEGGALDVSISIGAVTCHGWTSQNQVKTVLAQADAALYRAKAEGRNRIIAEAFAGFYEKAVLEPLCHSTSTEILLPAQP